MVTYLPHFLILLQWAAILAGLALIGAIPKVDGKQEDIIDFIKRTKRWAVFFAVVLITYYGLVDDVLLYKNVLTDNSVNGDSLKHLPEDNFYVILFYCNSHFIANILRTLVLFIPLVAWFELVQRQTNALAKGLFYFLFGIGIVFILASLVFIFL